MPPLVVSGVTIPVSVDGGTRDRDDFTDRGRSFNGTFRVSATGSPKRRWNFSTPPVSSALADYYEGILTSLSSQVCSGDLIGSPGNLLLFSQQFNDANWVKNNVTVSANQAFAPDGVLDGDKIQEDNTNNSHSVTQSVTAANGVYTFSVWLTAGERTKAVVLISDGVTGNAGIGVDLATGTTFSAGLAAGSWTSISSSVEAFPLGWYRVTVTGTRGAGTASIAGIFVWTTALSYLGTTGNGIFAWGAQLEGASSSSGYVLTTSAAVPATTATCFSDLTGRKPIKVSSRHRVVLDFSLEEA